MMNTNGLLQSKSDANIDLENRGYKYGDALFETLKVVNGKIFFWEDHYFRLMASMRILRMDIPMNFTMEFLEEELLKTVEANNLLKATVRVRLNIDRGEGGKYLPLEETNINYNITVEAHHQPFYGNLPYEDYIVDLYKDFYMAPGFLSGLKSNNKTLQVIGSIYASENQLNNCLVLNTNKSVIEALNGNLFLVKGDVIKTPPLDDGCLKGVMRKQIIDLLKNNPNYKFEETSISPFELQKADELFITNVIVGIQSIGKYRKKTFANNVAVDLIKLLNAKLRLT
ncbi:aminotransferase class IV [Winogradskyella immobilis]|uniref:branched-chain-amino-acid transaminase n=1 Tax=Winogradskyella immobilis TaxID=2816852 RepID=A0ABS8EQT2_9FLAO|nr:aminotransferase class IV [Winogradskyella immobilis]MCC1485566.1 aminotransferase class IV [Winogradskyella immobilis]MCG0017658.1 aminotransferase class IV [Winogradskyella immobilis]